MVYAILGIMNKRKTKAEIIYWFWKDYDLFHLGENGWFYVHFLPCSEAKKNPAISGTL